MTRRDALDVVASLLGAALIATALVVIWVARVQYGAAEAYVSELGATGAPTAHEFEIALLLVVAGGALVAFAGKDVRSRVRFLAFWAPAVSIWIACSFFLVASQVTCKYECPLPTGTPFDWQDFIHICCAVLAFAAACLAMLQTSFAVGHRVLAVFSLTIAISVGVISGIGGILSLAKIGTAFGGYAEFTATTLAIGWVIVYGIVIAVGRIQAQRLRVVPGEVPGEGVRVDEVPADDVPADEVEVGDIRSRSRLASPTST